MRSFGHTLFQRVAFRLGDLRKYNASACEYEIRTVDGMDYLLIEWKSGDYRWGGFDTNYYIFVRDMDE